MPRSVFAAAKPRLILKQALSLEALVAGALAEDLGERGDVTSQVTVTAGARAAADVVSRATGVLAGRAAAQEVLRQTGLGASWYREEGDRLSPGTVVARVDGPARTLLAAERTLLNLLCRLSGIATLTAVYVDACDPVAVLDTRKTTPGLRELEKAAVRAGGGCNHRNGLFDQVLVKDNHLALGGVELAAAVRAARAALPDAPVEIEADDLDGVRRVIAAGADWVLLDNMNPGELRAAVSLAAGRVRLEASGSMTPEGAGAAAACGVDAVSVGALTHSAPALDLGLDLVISPAAGAAPA